MPALTALARMVADVATSLDLSGDEAVSVDFATGLLEDLAAGCEAIADNDRSTVARLIAEYAHEQPDANRKRTMLDLPESLVWSTTRFERYQRRLEHLRRRGRATLTETLSHGR